jgi:zinc protease
MKSHKIFTSIFLASLILGVFAAPVLGQKGPKDKFVFGPLNPIQMPKVQSASLKNGLKLFLVEDHLYPTIDLRAMVRVGSYLEPADKTGLASITGQVLRTGGTQTMPGDAIDKELETLAATVETGIGQTSGYITVSVLKEDIDKALNILADILVNPAFPEDKIDLAKMMQRASVARRNDNVNQIAFREYRKLIYGQGSPYARQAEYATIAAINRDDIVNFYKTYFRPNNAIIAVVGDFQAKEMIGKIRSTLEKWPAGKITVPPLPKVEYQYRSTVNLVKKPDVNQSNIMLGHIGGLMSNPDFPALSVMNSILSNDRMFKKIRTAEGLAYSVWGNYGAGFDYPGVFSCGAQTKSQSTVYAIDLMLQEMKRIGEQEVTDEELAKAKDEYLNGYVFDFDSKAKIVNRLMTYAFFGYPLDYAEKVKLGVEKVTKADVLRVAKKYLQPDKVQILVVGKEEDFDKPLSTLGTLNVIDITIPAAPPAKK